MKNKKEKTVIGIYARKSKFTGKGESVDNQIKACEEYVRTNFVKNGEESINVKKSKSVGCAESFPITRVRAWPQVVLADAVHVYFLEGFFPPSSYSS